ncbi:MAG: hypothetical protein ACUVRF_09185, partial [Desulfotomaculales bacterium]
MRQTPDKKGTEGIFAREGCFDAGRRASGNCDVEAAYARRGSLEKQGFESLNCGGCTEHPDEKGTESKVPSERPIRLEKVARTPPTKWEVNV